MDEVEQKEEVEEKEHKEKQERRGKGDGGDKRRTEIMMKETKKTHKTL